MKPTNSRRVAWWAKPAERPYHVVLVCVMAAALAIVLSGCGSVETDTSRPTYKIRAFETQDQVDRKHELRRQRWRLRQDNRRDNRRANWRLRHGMY